MPSRSEFFADLDDEIRRQSELIATKIADEAVTAGETQRVVSRLKIMLSEYTAWAQRNGFLAKADESTERLTFEIGESAHEKSSVTFHRDIPGHYAVTVSEPFDPETNSVTIPTAQNTRISDWKDDLFEAEVKSVVRKLVKDRTAALTKQQ